MTVQITIKIDAAETVRKLNAISAGLGDKALRRGINETAKGAKTQMSQAIRAAYRVSAKEVNERLSTTPAKAKGALTFTGYLVGNSEPGGRKRSLNLIRFLDSGATKRAFRKAKSNLQLDALHFKVRTTGVSFALRGAWILNKPGNPVVMRDPMDKTKIISARTIGIPQMFSAKKNTRKVNAWIRDNFNRKLAHEIKFFLSTIK